LRHFTEFGNFREHYVKVVEDTPIFLRQKCSPENVVLAIYVMYGEAEDQPRREHKVRHSIPSRQRKFDQ